MDSVNRTPQVYQTQEWIKQWIQKEENEPGKKLPTEMTLCKEIGVSRSTVREALRLLEMMGYVEMRPGSGAFLLAKRPNSQFAAAWLREHSYEVLDILEVRALVEPGIARLAALRVTDDEIVTLVGLHTLFCQFVGERDAAKLAQYDEAFHKALAAATHNALLVDTHTVIAKSMQGFRNRTFAIHDGEAAAMAHERILRAVRERNPILAEQSMRDHLDENVRLAESFRGA